MQRNTLFGLILLLIVSCSKSDDNSEKIFNISNYLEPNLTFLITEEELINGLGDFDSRTGNGTTLGFKLIYNSDINGESERNYEFNFTSVTQTEPILTDIQIIFFSSPENIDYLINFLENRYGSYEHLDLTLSDKYQWATNILKLNRSK